MENVLQVALDVPIATLFHYVCEDFLISDIGALVQVPFGRGNQKKIGVIVQQASKELPHPNLKKISRIFRELPVFSADYMDFCAFAARYYHVPLGQVLLCGVPPYFFKNTHLPREEKSKESPKTESPQLVLNQEQEAALLNIQNIGNQQPILLFGVTGSGKTEVYFQQIESVLKQNKQVLLMVPEINLTPQLENRLKKRFPFAHLALLHSDLTNAARAREWLKATSGKANIVLGTRLSIFTPMPQLALIVVDEEHDASFKQQDGFRYHARDLAVYRANQLKIPIILGSATPSLESWNNALLKRYARVDLKNRANRCAVLPQISTVDLKKISKKEGFSTTLLSAIEERLKKGEQSLVFLNRRGFSPVLACPSCGWILDCPDCSAHMVFHIDEQKMRCHHCGRHAFVPRFCENCGNQDIFPQGFGTQRLEENLTKLFPNARILRIDRDSVKSRKEWLEKWQLIENNQADILVGTQMLSKGHDFQNLTLVGILGADVALFSGDFRSQERLFALLTQVSGRAGRTEKKGEVLIETRFAEHSIFKEIAHNHFSSFAMRDLNLRKECGFAPFVFHAMLRADSFQMEESLAFLNQAKNFQAPDSVMLFDPVPMNMARLAKRERAQMLIESDNRGALHGFLNIWMDYLQKIPHGRDLRWHVEIDPQFI